MPSNTKKNIKAIQLSGRTSSEQNKSTPLLSHTWKTALWLIYVALFFHEMVLSAF